MFVIKKADMYVCGNPSLLQSPNTHIYVAICDCMSAASLHVSIIKPLELYMSIQKQGNVSPEKYGLPEIFVWLMVFCGRERIRTEQSKDIVLNKSHCKCISSSKEVINAIYSVDEYANSSATFIIQINDY